MKKIITLIIFVVITIVTYGQDLVMSAEVESTVAGAQYGGCMMYETKNMFGVAAFYQKSIEHPEERKAAADFYGLKAQVPIVKCERLVLFGSLRAGFINEKFIVVIPGVETRVNIGERFGIGIGTSFRMNYPSISARLILKVF